MEVVRLERLEVWALGLLCVSLSLLVEVARDEGSCLF